MTECTEMVGGFIRCVVIVAILGSIPRLEAARKDIFNFYDDRFTVDNKTRAVAEITRKCLLSEKMVLVVSEELNDKLVKYLHRSESASITSLASSKLFVDEWYSDALKSKELYYGRHLYRFLWKSSGFLVAAYSPRNLKEQLDDLKNSRWWNPAGIFILIEDEDNSVVESCSNAYDFLSLAWTYGLLSSIFLCREQDGSLSTYSYNPYGSSAPQPWLKNREFKGQQGYPWSLFKWEKYDGRRYECESIFFDKTTSLNGYPVLTNAFSLSPFLYLLKNGTTITQYKGEDGWIMRDTWNFLNASIVNVPLSAQDAMSGWVNDDGTFHGNLIDINSGKVDLGLNSIILQPLWRVTITYPHTAINFCIVTRSRGTIPWLLGSMMIFDKWTMMCIYTVYFVSIIIFGYFDKRRYCLAYFNVVRISLAGSVVRPPTSTNLRIILCFVFIMPTVLYSTYQGQVLSILKNPSHYTEIDSLKDLEAFGFHIEGPDFLQNIAPTQRIRDRFVGVNDLDDCLLKLHNEEPVACVNYCFTVYVKASHDKSLHIAKQHSPYYQNRYTAKPDWPLLDRFNVVVQRIVEAGLIQFYRLQSRLEKTAFFSHEPSDSDAVVINMKDFHYVFIQLGIGLVCATLAFIGELILGRLKRRKISKTRVKPAASTLPGFKISSLMSRAKV